MKCKCWTFVTFLFCVVSLVKIFADSPEVEKARRYGAHGQVTFRIVNYMGEPVPDAEADCAFWGSHSSRHIVVFKGRTSTNGLFVATGRTVDSMNYTLIKEGYYPTRGAYWFYRPSGLSPSKNWSVSPTTLEFWLYHQEENKVKDGRWLPWNPTNTVVLKEKRNPIPMYAKRVDAVIPVRDAPVGFDLEVGDWVAPHGSGKNADIWFTYRSDIKDIWTWKITLSLACTNTLEGFCRVPKDTWSELSSAYEAPLHGYQQSVELLADALQGKFTALEEIKNSEYLIFRVRTVLDENGNPVSNNYGKIYGPIEYGENEKHHEGTVRFTYYFNPTPNDRNLEFDPSRNLFTNLASREEVYNP